MLEALRQFYVISKLHSRSAHTHREIQTSTIYQFLPRPMSLLLPLALCLALFASGCAGYDSAASAATSNSVGGTKCDKNPLTELTFQLSGANLLWPCDSTKNIYVQSGRYVPRNVIVTRAQLQRDSAFVALPRYKQGVPFTLGKVNLKKGQCLAKIAPYPCWAIQEEGNCQALQSVVDVAVDQNVSAIKLDMSLTQQHTVHSHTERHMQNTQIHNIYTYTHTTHPLTHFPTQPYWACAGKAICRFKRAFCVALFYALGT